MQTRGVHRVKNESGVSDGVWITDGFNAFEVPEAMYIEHEYSPTLTTLPWSTAHLEPDAVKPRGPPT